MEKPSFSCSFEEKEGFSELWEIRDYGYIRKDSESQYTRAKSAEWLEKGETSFESETATTFKRCVTE